MAASRNFRLALIQLAVGGDKIYNVCKAVNYIKEAKDNGSELVVLPECFNSPYGIKYFPQYAEDIPFGNTCIAMSNAAKDNGVYLVAGSIPERDGDKYYNTCTVWGPQGNLLGTHRKVHLFDIDIPGEITFKESDVLSAGESLTVISTELCKIGIGICYDIRFEEMARLYRNFGCNLLLYPGAFNMKTGPLHWEHLQRARAIDNQLFVAGIAPAQVSGADYVSWGHSGVIDPWGNLVAHAGFAETIVYADIEMHMLDEIREQIPIFKQRRKDVYDTVLMK